MAYTSEVINDGTGILRKGSGIVTGREMIDAARAMKIPPLQNNFSHSFIDVTDATEFRVSTADVQALAKLAQAFSLAVPRMLIALVSPTDIGFGVFRMFEGMAGVPGWKIRVFRTREEGWAWLNAELAARAG